MLNNNYFYARSRSWPICFSKESVSILGFEGLIWSPLHIVVFKILQKYKNHF